MAHEYETQGTKQAISKNGVSSLHFSKVADWQHGWKHIAFSLVFMEIAFPGYREVEDTVAIVSSATALSSPAPTVCLSYLCFLSLIKETAVRDDVRGLNEAFLCLLSPFRPFLHEESQLG